MAQKEKGKSLTSSFQFLRVQSTREGNRTAFLEVDIKKRLRCRKFHFLKLHLTLAEELRETKRKKASVNCTVLYKEYKVTFTPTPPPPRLFFLSVATCIFQSVHNVSLLLRFALRHHLLRLALTPLVDPLSPGMAGMCHHA